jgi:hypothetical protein
LTNDEAYDSILATFKAAWDTLGAGFVVSYPNVPLDPTTKAAIDRQEIPFCRVSVKPNTRQQATLAGVGGRRFDQTGLFTAQIFTLAGDGGALDRTLTRLVERAFEGISTPNGVWFRNVRTTSSGTDGHYWMSLVVAEWEYQEVR